MLAWVVALLAFAWVNYAQAHGGSLHAWDFETPGYNNYTRYTLATCSSFAPYNASKGAAFIPGAIPFWPVDNSSASLNVTGFVEVTVFIDTSCAITTTMIPYLLFTTSNGAAYANKKVYAYGMTGNCSAGVTDVYRHNATLGDARGNMMWWRDGVTDPVNGTMWGSSPNVFNPRRPSNTTTGSALTSLLLVPPPSDSAPLCCNLDWLPAVDTQWLAEASANCSAAASSSSAASAAHGRRRRLRARRAGRV